MDIGFSWRDRPFLLEQCSRGSFVGASCSTILIILIIAIAAIAAIVTIVTIVAVPAVPAAPAIPVSRLSASVISSMISVRHGASIRFPIAGVMVTHVIACASNATIPFISSRGVRFVLITLLRRKISCPRSRVRAVHG
jgi:hypothetical protein